jgi:TonB family protein
MEEIQVVGMSPKSENTDVVFDMPLEKVKKTEESKVKYTEVKVDETEVSQKEGEIFQVVEQMPEFPGGMQKAMEFLGKNIKYPVAAQEAKIEGRVIVQFVVGKDGSISDVQTVRGVSPELDAEAIRVVSMMPNWNPGKQRGQAVSVKYSMPIMFRLQTSQPKAEAAEAPGYLHLNLKVDKDADPAYVDAIKNQIRSMKYPETFGAVKIHGAVGKSPLIIVDGKELGYGMHIMNKIPVDQIESISVMKDETAIAQYGEKGKDGVISIITKKNK